MDLFSEDLTSALTRTVDLWPRLGGARVLMTGGTGFVGVWSLALLLRANDHHRLQSQVDVITRAPARFQAAYPELARHPAVRLVSGSLGSLPVSQADYSLIFHAGANTRIADLEANPQQVEEEITAAQRLLELARRKGDARFIYISSGAVYGRQPPDMLQVPEDYPGAPDPWQQTAAYAVIKRTCEALCAQYARQFGVDTRVARLFAFVGPAFPLHESYAIGNFLADVLNGRDIRVVGDGTPIRSYMYAGDMAEWIWTIALAETGERVFNVGSGDPISIAALARLISRLAYGKERVRIAQEPDATRTPQRYVPAVGRAQQLLGLRDTVSLEDSIQRTLLWYRHREYG